MATRYLEHQKAAQENKLRRLIRVQGEEFEFRRPILDGFNEPSEEEDSILVNGVFHETAMHVSRESTEGTTTRSRPSPMILMLKKDSEAIHIADILLYHDKQYKVSEVKNIAEGDFAVNVSLEEVLGDGQRFSPRC